MHASAEAIVDNHLSAAMQGVEAVLEDYAPDCVLLTPEGTYRGIAEIRAFFSAFLAGLPGGFFDAFKLRRREFVGDFGYIVWESRPRFAMATDTFVVRGGKIVFQTFAGQRG